MSRQTWRRWKDWKERPEGNSTREYVGNEPEKIVFHWLSTVKQWKLNCQTSEFKQKNRGFRPQESWVINQQQKKLWYNMKNSMKLLNLASSQQSSGILLWWDFGGSTSPQRWGSQFLSTSPLRPWGIWGMWKAATGWLTGLCCGQCGYWMWIVWKLTYSVNLSNLFSWWFDTVYHVWCLHSKYMVARCFPTVLSIDVLFSLVGWLTDRATPSWTTILGEGSQMDTYGIPNLVDQPSTCGLPGFRQSHMGHGPRLMDDHLS